MVGPSGSGAFGRVTVLPNGNYVVTSSNWDAPGPVVDVGAVSWGNGRAGIAGSVSAANSLVGSTSSDRMGFGGVIALAGGNYVVTTPDWDTPGFSTVDAINVGAITWGNGSAATAVGPVSLTNRVLGSTASASATLSVGFDAANGQIVVGRPKDDIVTWVELRPTAPSGGATQATLQTTGDLQLLTASKALVFATGTAGRSAKLTITSTCALILATRTATLWQQP